jgi:hypothetical protein
VITERGLTFPIMGFTVADGKIMQIRAIADPDRVRRIAVAVLSDDKVAALQMPRAALPLLQPAPSRNPLGSISAMAAIMVLTAGSTGDVEPFAALAERLAAVT